MMSKRIVQAFFIAILLCLNVGCDQLSKHLVRHTIGNHERIYLFDHYVMLTKVENTGAFLSLGNTLPKPVILIFLIILPLLVLGYGLFYLFIKRNLSYLKIIGLCFIIGGGFGNVFDRALYGSVTDFLHINFVIFHTGIFNLADVSIMTGVFILFLEIILNRQHHSINNSGNVPGEEHTII
jgi:signal peptidase II